MYLVSLCPVSRFSWVFTCIYSAHVLVSLVDVRLTTSGGRSTKHPDMSTATVVIIHFSKETVKKIIHVRLNTVGTLGTVLLAC